MALQFWVLRQVTDIIMKLSLLTVATSYLHTKGGWDHGDMWVSERDRTSTVFGVKGCTHALLGLTTEYFNVDNEAYKLGYVVILDDVGRSQIKFNIGGAIKTEEQTPGLLSCDEFRYFWVSWKDQYIEVGQGQTVGNRRFMAWQDPDHTYDIKAATVYSGSGVFLNQWRFNLVQGNSHQHLLHKMSE